MVDFQAIGFAAAAIGLLGFVPYVIAILKKKTVPHRTSWLVWAALGNYPNILLALEPN